MRNLFFARTFFSLILLIYVSSVVNSLEMTTEIIGSKYLNSLGYLGQDKSICIIDTGVDYTHGNLGDCSQSQFLSRTCQKVPTGFDFGDNDSNPFPNRNHGIYVAGVASSDNSLHAGVSPSSKVITIKITNDAMTLSDIEVMTNVRKGIDWCVANATKYNYQQVYLANSAGNQTYATWDYYVLYNNKRWAINYVTGNEQFVQAANLTPSVYVLETANLTATTLRIQVETFLNTTLNP